MQKIILTKGLPASGKSTWAKQYIKDHPDTKRVNKDDLRAMLDNSRWSSSNEKFILKARNYIVQLALDSGNSVIVDDTNLNPIHEEEMLRVAKENEVGFEVHDFSDVSVDECIKRDLARPNSVGEKVIKDMYNKFIAKTESTVPYPIDKTLLSCYIFDIDGTLALKSNRSPFEWGRVGEDTVNVPVASVYRMLESSLGNEYKFFIFSGRDSVFRKETEEWLQKYGIKYEGLFMRPENNMEKDSIIKARLFDENIRGKYNVAGVFDDRQQVVDMWRSMGITCFQVAEGNF